MPGLHHAEYPAITKAQRLTAERLGVKTRSQSEKDVVGQHHLLSDNHHHRPFDKSMRNKRDDREQVDSRKNLPPAMLMQKVLEESSSTWMPPPLTSWVWDSGSTEGRLKAAPLSQRAQHRVNSMAPPGGSENDSSLRARSSDPFGGRKKSCHHHQHRNPAASIAEPSSTARRRHRPAVNRTKPSPGVRTVAPPNPKTTSLSMPPPPPQQQHHQHHQHQHQPKEDRAGSLEQTLQDIEQISRCAQEEAFTFERFLALEVEPTIQKVFDSAVKEHAVACSSLGTDHLRSLTTTFEDEEEKADDVTTRKNLYQTNLRRRDGAAGGGDRKSSGNTNAGTFVAVGSTGQIGSTTQAVRAVSEIDSDRSRSRSKSSGSVMNTSDLYASIAGISEVSSASLNTSATSTEAWRRAVRARVIEVSPPSLQSVRASLPAMRTFTPNSALDASTTGMITDTKTPGKRRTRLSADGKLPGGYRPAYYERDVGTGEDLSDDGGQEDDEKPTTGTSRSTVVATRGGSGGDGVLASASEWGRGTGVDDLGGKWMRDWKDEDDEDDNEYDEEEQGWDVLLPKLVRPDISAKMVGLSSVIRRKAAESSEDWRRRGQQRQQHQAIDQNE